MALIAWQFELNLARAETEYRRALEIGPRMGITLAQLGAFLCNIRRYDEGISAIRQGRALEPVSALVGFYAAGSLILGRDYDACLEECRRALVLDPIHFPLMWIQSWALSMQEKHEESVDVMERAAVQSRRQSFILGLLPAIYVRAWQPDRARAVLDELNERSRHEYVSALCFAETYLALGDRDRTFDLLERARQERCGFLTTMLAAPVFDSLRADPRLAAFERQLGLPPA